jgi:hypothetical protein
MSVAMPAEYGCSRCKTPIELGDLRCAVCSLPAPSPAVPDIDRARAQLLRCDDCGAAIGYDANAEAPACGFCGAVMHVEQPADPVEVARAVVPFAVDRERAVTALRGWLATRGWFAPRTLHDEAVLDSVAPLWWAAWVVNASARVAWTADSDDGAHRSAWAPHAGELPLAFGNLVVSASRGLGEEECAGLAPHYDLARAVDASAPSDVTASLESFDVQRSAARAHVQRGIERVAKVRVQRVIPGRRFRNIRVACLLEGQTTDRVGLPAWVLAYRYRGSPYRAIVHGERAEIVLGTSPIDWGKVARLVGVIALVAAAIVAIVMLVR